MAYVNRKSETSVSITSAWDNSVINYGDNVSMLAGSGDDSISNDEGNNAIIDGGEGNDWLDGGDGYDVFVYTADEGKDFIMDFTGVRS